MTSKPDPQFWLCVLAQTAGAIRNKIPRAALILKLQRRLLRELRGRPKTEVQVAVAGLHSFVCTAWEVLLDVNDRSAPPNWTSRN